MFTRGPANAGRLGIYAANLDIIRERPILGLGFGRYQSAAKPYYAAHPAADRRSHAHNNFLQIAAESGLVGLAAFGLLYATAIRRGWEAVRRASRVTWPAAAGGFAGLLGFLVGGLTQYTFGDAEVAITMWVAVAVLLRSGEPAAPAPGA
jgi:O-antigen ligase